MCKPGRRGRLERFHALHHIVMLLRARQGRDRHGANFPRTPRAPLPDRRCDAIGKPGFDHVHIQARQVVCAMRIFSSVFMEKPGDCSPSRSVVSKMRTTSMGLCLPLSNADVAPVVQFIFVLLLIILPYTSRGGSSMDLANSRSF